MPLRDQVNDDVKNAMRSGDTRRRDALRLLTAAIKQKEVDERTTLTDADVVAVIEKMIKQRREAIAQFQKGGRADLVEKEEFEISVLQQYMPQAMSEAEIDAAISDALTESGAKAPQDMGKAMAILKRKLAGRADMAQVSARVRTRLSV